ncbi:MAG: ABC transporter ATP-binding protein [Gemmatimonadetes bacterium]|nr:ABC transporter ATP-binding protein [Gemmatimonadota bacterium]
MSERRNRPWRLLDPGPFLEGLALVWESGRGWSVLQGVVLALQGALPLVALYLMKRVVDAVAAALSGGARDVSGFTTLMILTGVVALATAALRTVSSLISEVQTARLVDRVQELLHEKSSEVDLQFYESAGYHDTLHRAQNEAPYRPSRIVTELAQVGQGALTLTALLTLLVSFHWLLVVALLLAALPGLAIKARFSTTLYQWTLRETANQRLARYLNTVLTSIEFAKELRLFDLGGVFRERHKTLRTTLRRDRLRMVTRRSLYDLAANVLAVCAVFASMYVIARQALDGKVTIGDMVMYFGAFQRAQDVFRDLLAGLAGLYEDNLFLADFKTFMSLAPMVRESPSPRAVPRPLRRGLEFDHVTFRYPGTDVDVLKDVSFHVRPGEHLALVGENGSGKTTLVKLLCRLYDPTEGAVRIDGVDLREFGLRDLRREFGVVFQDYAKYQLSARDNIWMGNVTLPHDTPRVLEAAQRTGADAVIRALPRGYDTMLGRQFAEGVDLSIGQWQKLAIARAFMRESQLIVLDEPTAALDPLAEAEVFQQFQALARDRTTLLISHRLSTVRHADRILVMVDGSIAEVGAHEALLAQAGVYANLFETQARPYR